MSTSFVARLPIVAVALLVAGCMTVGVSNLTQAVAAAPVDALALEDALGRPDPMNYPRLPAPEDMVPPAVPAAPAPEPAPASECTPHDYPMPDSPPAASYDVGRGYPDAEQWRYVAQGAMDAGFRGDCLALAVAVSRAESRLGLAMRNPNGASMDCSYVPRNSDCRMDVGVWQINAYWHPDMFDPAAANPSACADDARCAAEWVYEYTDGGTTGWAAWCTFGEFSVCTSSSDHVAQYIPQARLAAMEVGGWS